jgi:hypothetical protein
MLDLIAQLKNACDVAEEFELSCGRSDLKKEELLEWKAATTLERLRKTLICLTDNAEYADKGLYISYKQYARFLAASLMVLKDGQ